MMRMASNAMKVGLTAKQTARALFTENGVKCYEGDWKDHNFHGKGIEYDENGDKRHGGDFIDGEFVKDLNDKNEVKVLEVKGQSEDD